MPGLPAVLRHFARKEGRFVRPVLLVAINARFTHTSLSVRSLAAYAAANSHPEVAFEEFTINQSVDFILQELYTRQPGVLCFSCYIWNMNMVAQLVRLYKKVAPQTLVYLGGPQASYTADELLQTLPVEGIVCGEGEQPFLQLLKALQTGDVPRGCLPAVPTPPLALDRLPFPYPDLAGLENRILYYESSRGCPFSCSYCLSSATKGVQYRSFELVTADFDRFLAHKVMQVKLVDRTFNCDARRALRLWQYLIEHDNGVTNFHFEIGADLLTDEQLALLRQARPGLFQFEIGVQSTNERVLQEIERPCHLAQLFARVDAIAQGRNIHQHLDLIAGLPGEDFASFRRSFDAVCLHWPQQLQLGFLKVLPGSTLQKRATELGLLYSDLPPYEILSTPSLGFGELLQLKKVEEMVSLFYNSGRFRSLLRQTVGPSPFDFFLALGEYYYSQAYHCAGHAPDALATILKEFLERREGPISSLQQQLFLFDWCLREKPRRPPAWLSLRQPTGLREQVLFFLEHSPLRRSLLPTYLEADSRWLERRIHVVPFEWDVTDPSLPKRPTTLLFDYSRRDLLGAATVIKIELPSA